MDGFVIALGMFDGVHLGHRALLSEAARLAHENGDLAVAFTYTNPPKALFGVPAPQLTTVEQREAVCRALSVDRVDAVPFTKAFAGQSPEAFLQWLLTRYEGRLHALVCGYDFRFGKDAAGDGEALTHFGKQLGFTTEVLPPVLYDGLPCSSTRVRAALTDGELDAANAMLARPYAITGTVVHNRGIGQTLGYPTANLDYGELLLPKDGVYASALVWDGEPHAAVTNVGTNPTVGGERRTLETFVLHGAPTLYGKRATVLFLERLRGERAFPSREALSEQIGHDAETAKKVFKESEKSVYNARALW